MHQVPKGVTCHGKLGEISSCDEKPTMGKVFKIHQTELLHSRQDLPRLKMFSRGLSCWCKFQNAKGAMPPHSSVFPSDLARIQRITSSQAPLANFQQPGKTGTGKQGPNLINQEVSEIMIYPKMLIFLTNNKNNNHHNRKIIAT
jgi:hypothetical protein